MSLATVSTTICSPRLPAELTDHIIHLLHGEKLALLAISLVCRSWVTAARYHLFRSIRLERIEFLRPTNPRLRDPMIASVESQDAFGEARKIQRPMNKSLRFLELLKDEDCTFRHAVQSLSIDQRGSSRRGACSPGSCAAEYAWIDDVLATTSSSLSCLKSLQLEGVDYTHLSPASRSILREQFRSVSDLDFTGLRFAKQTDAAELISSFPDVKNFTWLTGANSKFSQVGDASSQEEEEDCSLALSVPSQVQTCTIGAEMACSTVGRGVASKASNLTILSEEKYVAVTQVPALNELLAASADRLENLVLNLWHWTATPGSFIDIYEDCQHSTTVDIQLTKNTNLSTLFFQQFRFTHPVVNIASLIASVSSTTLSTVVFEIDFSSAEYDDSEEVHPLHLCDYDWESVDEAIRESKFAEEVKAVAVVVYWAGESALTIESAIRQRMRWCEEKKVLVTRFL